MPRADEKLEPSDGKKDRNLNPLARASSSHQRVRVFRQGVTKSSGAKIERFAYIVSFENAIFGLCAPVTGGGPLQAPLAMYPVGGFA